MRKLATVAAIALAALSILGCPPAEPPKVAPAEPLVVGKSPDNAAILMASDKPAPVPLEEAGRVARGNAPAIWLDSLTTSGKVTLPPGKVVIVAFWATWCAPCAKAFPKFQELYVKYKGSGLEVAAVSVDDEKSGVADFARTHGARFPVGWDDTKNIANAYKVESMPTTLIIDKEGNIAHVHKGYHDGEHVEIEREIKALL